MKRVGVSRIIRSMRGAMLRYMPLMITCRQFEDFVIDYIEGTLPDHQRRLFELHIKMCRECREYLAAYKRTLELVNRTGGADVQEDALPDLPEDLVEAVIAARRSD